MENLAQIDRIPAVAERLRAAQRDAVEGIAELLAEPLPHAAEAERRALAAYYFAVINGLAIVWLIDPSIVPTGDQLRLAELPAGAGGGSGGSGGGGSAGGGSGGGGGNGGSGAGGASDASRDVTS